MPAASGISVYDSNAFFPIDMKGFGNTSGQAHNYHFTTEISREVRLRRRPKIHVPR
jgi:hypothetical protein